MTWRSDWAPEADDDLRQVPWQDAASIVREVNLLVDDGVGDVRVIVLPNGARARVLYLPGYRVSVTHDRATRTVHVWGVWRVRP
ncbi:MAG: hypothetical protein KF819_31390 [Labilithrix sp.]|nr:hypothetical protein [Labilithrix sp.]